MAETLPEPQVTTGAYDVPADRKPPESAEGLYPAPGFTAEDAEKVHAIWKAEYDANEERKAEAKKAEEEAQEGTARYDTKASDQTAEPASKRSSSKDK